jgi:hypothetical protein
LIRCTLDTEAPVSEAVLRMLTPAAGWHCQAIIGGPGSDFTSLAPLAGDDGGTCVIVGPRCGIRIGGDVTLLP